MRDGAGTVEPSAPRRPNWRLLVFVWRQVVRHPGMLAITLVAAVVVALANIATVSLFIPFIQTLGAASLVLPPEFPLAFVADLFEGYDDPSKVRIIAGLIVLLQIIRGVATYSESRLSAYLKILVERDLRMRVFGDLQRADLSFLASERVANLQTLVNLYPKQTADIADQYLAALARVMTGATYVVALLALSVPLTLLGLALGLISLLTVQLLARAVRDNARITNELRVRLQQTTLQSLQGMRVIRLFGRGDDAQRKYERELTALRRQSFRGGSIQASIPLLQSIVNAILLAGLLIAASYILPSRMGSGWVALLAIFLVIMTRLASPLQNIGKRRAKIVSELPAVDEIMTFLEKPKIGIKEGSARFERLARGIRFERVGFAYEQGRPVLHDVDLDIPAGRTTALVGGSGSGKSTVLDLVARLADPTSGRILVDARDLREFNSKSWRARLAVVSQEAFLFNDTVEANIRFGRPDATRAEVEAAARTARAHEFIASLENGYDTLLGDRGTRLSGGQAQRIALARALLVDPDVLILDEATSALDAATERAVQEAIEEASKGRTVIVVAHRLATVRAADRIYVLEAGRVVESGTHEELLGAEGAYHRYVTLQDVATDPRKPAPSAAPAPAPTLAPAPLAAASRVILSLDKASAIVLREGRAPAEIPFVAAPDAASQHAAAKGSRDVAVLAVGSDVALVRVDGEIVEGLALYLRDPDGRERRVRVRETARAATTRLRLHG